MKKLLSLFLTLTMIFSLAACGKVIPNARQITSSVGSVGALFLLKRLVIVE